ncbi:MAG TPA: CBS domain-containing protein [Thermoanaerobaculia bacterium]|nr:CBS domain-containing protein [Thermoanaerobaculia bacterium]
MRPITAGDVMNPRVLTVRDDISVEELADFLVENEISGAPVEDATGKLVGVVSVTDIVAVVSEGAKRERDRRNASFYQSWERDPSLPEDLDVEDGDIHVREIMTPIVYAVPEEMPVSEVAERMIESHLHRLLVTRGEKVVGILSTSDLLGLLVDKD